MTQLKSCAALKYVLESKLQVAVFGQDLGN
jgi:hypothetical protein